MIQGRLVRRPSNGQIVLAALIGLYFLALYSQDWYWPRFGVPAVPDLPFVDIRFLTTSWECTRDGVDVFPRNLCDPHGMRFNALTLILLALWLGSTSAFYPFGIGEWWADASSRFPYDELVNWLLFAYLAAAFVLTLEREVRPFSEPGAAGSHAR